LVAVGTREQNACLASIGTNHDPTLRAPSLVSDATDDTDQSIHDCDGEGNDRARLEIDRMLG
jgi:hypothetical protein